MIGSKTVLKYFALILALCAVVACSKSEISTGTSLSVLSNQNLYLGGSAVIRVYSMNSKHGDFVTELLAENGSLSIPKALTEGNFGYRKSTTTAQPLDLIIRVYQTSNPTGDFYFETPVLGPKADVSNVTTALSWVLRFGFQDENVFISQAAFERLSKGIEVNCTDCRSKTNSEVVKLILNTPAIRDEVYAAVLPANPTITLSKFVWSPPPPLYAWSTPNLTMNGVSFKSAKETTGIDVSIIFVDTQNSAKKIMPIRWDHAFPDASLVTQNDPSFKYTFTYDDQGLHSIKPYFENPEPLLDFQFSVGDVNRNPYCQDSIQINLNANKIGMFDLASQCGDLDRGETGLSYALSSGPPNLVLSDFGQILWTPPQAANNLAYSVQIKFVVTDSQNGFFEKTATINVTPDKLPTFTSLGGTLTAIESTSKQYVFVAEDLDGDALDLFVEPVGVIATGFPDGAGQLNLVSKTVSGNQTTFTWSFTPSFLQAIGSDGTFKVRLLIKYDALSLVLDSTIRLHEEIIEINLTNMDDPPSWSVQPSELNVTEGVSLANLNVGTAVDNNPNPTAVTYSIEFAGGIYCNYTAMVVKTVSGDAILDGPPDYFSSPSCSVRILATDANGLSTFSQYFDLIVDNVNQPVSEIAGGPTSFTDVYERQLYRFPMDQMFLDLDDIQNDQRELFTIKCYAYSDITYSTLLGECKDNNLPFVLGREQLYATLTGTATSAGNYFIELEVTDNGPTTATHRFSMTINQTPAPMDLEVFYSGNSEFKINTVENQTYPFTLRASTATPDPIDDYNFLVGNPVCSKIGGGNCPANLVRALGSLAGTGTTDIQFEIKPDFTAGNAPLPGTKSDYIISFALYKDDDINLRTEITLQIQVDNTNRAPTALRLSTGSFGCVGDSANANADTFNICLDVSKDVKSGQSWQRTYVVGLLATDADTVNDIFTYSLSNFAPGSIINTDWSFKLPSCMSPGSSTINRTFSVDVADGRGGTFSRQVNVKFVKANASAICLQ